ncbi:MAG: S8 family serine peptidase [Hyphomicrobiales bacterium]
MRATRRRPPFRPLLIAAVAAFSLAALADAGAQKMNTRGGGPNIGSVPSSAPRGPGPMGPGGDFGPRGPYYSGAVIPGVLMGFPNRAPPPGRFIDDGSVNDNYPGQRPQQQGPSARRGGSGVPPANERRMLPDEVVVQVPNTLTPQRLTALEQRYNLTRLEQQSIQLSNSTMIRWRIPDRRSVSAVIRALEADTSGAIAFAQPNYLFALQQQAEPAKATEGNVVQYALAKMRLALAHKVTRGDNILIAVIDSGIDVSHPELAGVIAGSFDTLDPAEKPHAHGTGIAGLIAARARLTGVAPEARILAVRTFGASGSSAQATTFNILKGLDWSAANGARIINMSFAGPGDPAISRSLAAAAKKGVVLIAAAGNAGASSPPLYPAADPNVIAVTATDSQDKLFEPSNRGRHIAVAAPGVDILSPAPDAGYQVTSGTSMSAAEVSGVVALMLARQPSLTPAAVRGILMATAKDLGPRGRDDQFGAGLADAYQALMALEPSAATASQTTIPVMQRR